MEDEGSKVSKQRRRKEQPGKGTRRMERGSEIIPTQTTRARSKNRKTQSEIKSDQKLLESSSSILTDWVETDFKNNDKNKVPMKIYVDPSRMRLPSQKVWLDLQPSSVRIMAPPLSRDAPKSRVIDVDAGTTTLKIVSVDSVHSISLETIPSSDQHPNVHDKAPISSNLVQVSSIFGSGINVGVAAGVEGTSTPNVASASQNLASSVQHPNVHDNAPSINVSSILGAGINGGAATGVEGTSPPNVASASQNLASSVQHPNVHDNAPSINVSSILGAGINGGAATGVEGTSPPNVASASQNLASSVEQLDPQANASKMMKEEQKDDTEHIDANKPKFHQSGFSKAALDVAAGAESMYLQNIVGAKHRSAEMLEDERIDYTGPIADSRSNFDVEKRGTIVEIEATSVQGVVSSARSVANSSQSIASLHRGSLNVSQEAVKMPQDHDRTWPNSTVEDRRADASKSNVDAAKCSAATLLSASSSVRLRSVTSSYQDTSLKTPKDGDIEDGERNLGLLFTSSKTRLASQCRIDRSDASGLADLDSKWKVFEDALKEMPEKSVDQANELHRTAESERLDVMEALEALELEGKSADQMRKVKIVLEEDSDRHFFLDYDLNVRETKAILAQLLGVDSINIILKANGRVLSDSELIRDFDIITVEKGLKQPPEVLAKGAAEQTKVVKVKVLLEDGTWKHVDVSLVVFGQRKQYIGGYRDKRTGQIYYHGITQTDPRQRNKESVTREVQACLPIKDVGVNTRQAGSTQTFSKELCVSITDKILTPRPYVPHNEVAQTMIPHRAAQIIQQAWRKHIFNKFILNRFERLAASLHEKAELQSTNWGKMHSRRLIKITAASFPSHRSHFSDALVFVSDWAQQTAWQLANTKTTFARKAALSQMLDLEQKMLYSIEKQRLKAVEENLRKQDMMFLEGTARSRATIYDKGNVTIIDDLNIQKANVFKEIFASYTRTDTSTTERLEVLNCLRDTFLQEFSLNSNTVTELVEILNREIDLLTMGFPKAQLVYLRKRFETQFLNLSKDPEVNPQAKYFRKSHITEKKYAIRRCKFCNKNLTTSFMAKHVRMRSFKICKSCVQLKHNATNQLNLGPYQRMLEVMRAKELENNCRSSIPFLIQPFGVYFLVNKIWNGKSILSGNSDITQLKMNRWLPNQDWSVWNMILLTEKEAVEHDAIPDPMAHYSDDFILQVRTRNILGRMHFRYLVDIDNDFKFGRQPGGTLPRDHKLYTNKFHEQFIPSNPVPGFFKHKENTGT